MRITFPPPTVPRASLPPVTRAVLTCMAAMSRRSGGILSMSRTELASGLSVTECYLSAAISALAHSRHILVSEDGPVGIIAVLAESIRAEQCGAEDSATLGKPFEMLLRQRVLSLFPQIITAKHKSSYLVPEAFKTLLRNFEHHHYLTRPGDCEIVAGPFVPGELSGLLTFIEEQLSARREVVLLYTRKNVSISVRRKARR